ncbi:ATPase, T2SS/T4P/T4SS family, partial [Isoptericola sp. NPDC056578]
MSDQPNNLSSLPIFGDADREPRNRPTTHALAGTIDAARPAVPTPAAATVATTASAVTDLPVGLGSTSTTTSTDSGAVDWKQVALLRSQASEQLTNRLGEERGIDLDAERELGRSIIQELVQSTAADRIHEGEPAWSLVEQEQMAESVFNALFGLGRLQPYVDDDTVENIMINGAENVWLEKTDGMLVRAQPVADSDAELLDFLAFVASRSEVNARSFSSASPRLHMRLDGGARLAAAAWVTAHPSVVVRRHRMRKVTLDDLIGLDMLTPVQASLLAAAVKAGKSIVVAGAQGAGKTTMVRALCSEFESHEKIGTFETEFELH